MRDPPPGLSEAAVIASLRSDYGLSVRRLTYLPLGQDSTAAVYRVETKDGSSYFLKVRAGRQKDVALVVPRCLRDRGIDAVVAPLPTKAGTLASAAGSYALVLYPYLGGRTGKEGGMSDAQWLDFGAILRSVHDAALPPDVEALLAREPWSPDPRALVRRLDAHIADSDFDDPAALRLADFWRSRRDEILSLLETAERLGQRLASLGLPCVVCHADIHTNNVLVDTDGRVWMVDWEDVVLAPRERDLMFVIGGISRTLVGPREESLFFEGYGAFEVDPVALAYYRYAWAVKDIAAYGDQVFFLTDLAPSTRHAAVDRLLGLFASGAIVSIAYSSEIA